MNDSGEEVTSDCGASSYPSKKRKKSEDSGSCKSSKSSKSCRTSSDDGFFYYERSRGDSGILADCDLLKYHLVASEFNHIRSSQSTAEMDAVVSEASSPLASIEPCPLDFNSSGAEPTHRRSLVSDEECGPFIVSRFLEKNHAVEAQLDDFESAKASPTNEDLLRTSKEKVEEINTSTYIKEKWKSFTSRTTLHGIKYAFDDGPVRLRRIIWLMCVAFCIGIFIFQAMDRLLTYFEYPSNVNMKVVYTRSLEFPAVTVCNYNKHRLTAVVDMNMYEFISRLYRPGGQYYQDMTTSGDALCSMNMTEFVIVTSHQQKDFIVKCTWQGLPCNGSIGFSPKITDFGVCYTFNGDANNRLRVVKAGSRSALGIILNVEQYEYMAGPDQETGIKILLHDPLEFPQVRDLGFAVSPGMHVLVGVKRQCLENLQPPYGVCQPGAVARSQCLADCTSNEVFARCGCRDPHMKPPSKYEDKVCSLTESFSCARENRDESSRIAHVQCSCPNPCKMKTYDPLLSYALMSGLDFKDIDIDYEQIFQSYERARATFEKVDEGSAERNKKLVDRYFQLFYQLMRNVTESRSTVEHGDEDASADQQVLLAYAKNYSALSEDFMKINRSFIDKVALATKLQPEVSIWETLVWDEHRGLDAFLDIRGTTSDLVSVLESCAAMENMSLSVPIELDILPDDCEDEDESTRTYLFYRKNILDKWEPIANESFLTLTHMRDEYEDTLSRLFDGTEFDHRLNDTYLDCLRIINETVAFWLPHLEDLVRVQRPRYLTSEKWGTKLRIAKRFEDFYKLNKIPDITVVQSRFNSCQFFMKPRWFDWNYNSYLNYVNNANQAYLGQASLENSLLRQARELEILLNKTFDLSSGHLEDFLLPRSNVTKDDLFAIFQSDEILTAEAVKQLQMQSYLSDLQQLLIKISDVRGNVVKAYQSAFQLALPSLGDEVVDRLQLVIVARLVAADESYEKVRQWLSTIKSDRLSSLVGIVDSFYDRYEQMMRRVQGRLVSSIQNFESASGQLKDDLRSYSERGKLDEDFTRENFIKVEVFFKELSYEHIQQQIGFQMLTLFSEIGGLLGLLLGASILTVFEFIDFLVVLAAGRIRAGCCRSLKKF